MGILYRNSQGIETPVAGLAPAGQLVPSTSLIQSGTVSMGDISSGSRSSIPVRFSSPMPDADYLVSCTVVNSNKDCLTYNYHTLTTNGFQLVVGNASSVDETNVQVQYTAFKLMTSEDRALDEEHIAQNTANFAPNFSATASYSVGDYCTYQGVLYRCTVQHTASAWNNSHFTQVTVGGQLKVQDISSSITTGDGYSSGTISVYRDGNTVQVLFNSVMTTAYNKSICSGLPRPLRNSYFCVQADGTLQELGLGNLRDDGSISSGNENAGMGPSKVWDGFITYLTRD